MNGTLAVGKGGWRAPRENNETHPMKTVRSSFIDPAVIHSTSHFYPPYRDDLVDKGGVPKGICCTSMSVCLNRPSA